MEEIRNVGLKMWPENPKGRDQLERLGINKKIISECIADKQTNKQVWPLLGWISTG
jgi:hypothetical protein